MLKYSAFNGLHQPSPIGDEVAMSVLLEAASKKILRQQPQQQRGSTVLRWRVWGGDLLGFYEFGYTWAWGERAVWFSVVVHIIEMS